jgi:hypothetical protein
MIGGISNIINMYGGTKIDLDTETRIIKIDDMTIKYEFDSQQRSIDPSDRDTIVNLTITNKKTYEKEILREILTRLSKAPISDIGLIVDRLWSELLKPIEPRFISLDENKENPIMIHTTNNVIIIDDMTIEYKFEQKQIGMQEWETIVILTITNKKTYDEETLRSILTRLSKAQLSDIGLIVNRLRSELMRKKPTLFSL